MVGHQGSPTPEFPHVGLIALVPDNWSDHWQPRHQVLTRLTAYFHVAWVTRGRHWRHTFARPGGRLRAPDLTSARGMLIWDERKGLPRTHRPARVAALQFERRIQGVLRRLRSRGCDRFVLYLWRPEFSPALGAADFDFACYHIDDEYTFSDVEQPIGPEEWRILREVDQVFVTSQGLFEKKGAINPNTMIVPNGVDFAAHATPVPEPLDLQPIRRPRIGYTGFLKRTLDWKLLEALAERCREWSFVFVGPKRPHPEIDPPIERLGRFPNVSFLPGKAADIVATYPQHFDVAMMPYRTDSYMNRYGYPLKLHEYLAAGCPVVGTPIDTLREFPEAVQLATDPDGWAAAIARALDPSFNTEAHRQQRQAIARRHDWDHLVAQIAERIVQGIDGRRPAG